MKNLLFAAVLLSMTTGSCTEKKQPQINKVKSTLLDEETKPVIAETPEEEGRKLVEGTDCLACHKVDSKLIGPSYQDIAAKYTDADLDHLAKKIIDGGKGVWGDVPMTAHSGMSEKNAQKMVKYILSLKKE